MRPVTGVTKRIIPCLDINNGRTVKGINFTGLRDAGDPIEQAAAYAQAGADEIVFLDITATNEKRKTMAGLARAVAAEINIPFTIGGGIASVSDAAVLLEAGADKVSINSSAVNNPGLISELAETFGNQFVVVAADARMVDRENGIFINGGNKATPLLTEKWVAEAESRGAGEFLITSMDKDGTKSGFDIPLLASLADLLQVPVIASGGAGNPGHFLELFTHTNVDAALAASVFHFGEILIPELKAELKRNNVAIRL